MQQGSDSSRRQFLGLAGGAVVLGVLPTIIVRPAEATPATMAAAIQSVTGGAAVRAGKVKLDIPPLVENGNTVPMTVSVAHPMAPEEMQAAIAKIVGDAKVNHGKVKLEIPPLVENGNTVPCTVAVDSPMTAADHVKAIHVFNERNPQPNVISVHLGPRAGRADFATRIRLADTQNVVAIAEMSDGSFWSASVEVVVTLGACLEGDARI
jgi:sulfur-oxidizing protein SoxY